MIGTSEYRSPSQSPLTPPVFPKKDQAIVIEVNEELVLNDYVSAVASIVQPKNILFASRIANNRVCIYLSDKTLVDSITTEHPILTIKDRELNLRRLVTPARRIIFSNVHPTIPHNILETIIKNSGLKPCSQISFLKAGALDSEFSHVLSFRRQIYVQPNDSISLPSTFLIKYDDLQHRIFLSYDEMTCFACKKSGHIANQCPNSQKETFSNSDNDEMDTSQSYLNPTETEQRTQKRTAPSTSTSIEDDISTLDSTQTPEGNQQPTNYSKPKTAPQNKKLKKSDSIESLTPLDEQLEPLKEMILRKPDSYILNFDQLVAFLENVKGSPDPLSIATEFTSDIEELLVMLKNIYPILTHRSIKNRITRIQNKISNQLKASHYSNPSDNNEPNNMSNSSQQ